MAGQVTVSPLRALANCARALEGQARALAELADALAAEPRDDDMVPKAEAARIAGVSTRTLDDARRSGELTFFGKQRSRVVKRADLAAWIANRRAPVVRDVIDGEDADLDRRVTRIERKRAR